MEQIYVRDLKTNKIINYNNGNNRPDILLLALFVFMMVLIYIIKNYN